MDLRQAAVQIVDVMAGAFGRDGLETRKDGREKVANQSLALKEPLDALLPSFGTRSKPREDFIEPGRHTGFLPAIKSARLVQQQQTTADPKAFEHPCASRGLPAAIFDRTKPMTLIDASCRPARRHTSLLGIFQLCPLLPHLFDMLHALTHREMQC